MSTASFSFRRAKAIRQCATISGHEREPIPFSPLLFARRSRRYLEELVLGSGASDIVIDSTFDRDSVVQFIAACEGADFSLTQSNVFEIELLCDEWSVFGKSIRRKITEFIEHTPSGQSLWLHRLLFRLGRGLSTSEAEDWLRCNLIGLVDDSAALQIPAAILCQIIDFKSYESRRDEYERLFSFCIGYLKTHGSAASQILRSLDVTRLSDGDLVRLCALEQLNWGVLNESVCRCLIGIRAELLRAQQQKGELGDQVIEYEREIGDLRSQAEQQGRQIEGIRNEIAREQHEKVAMKAANDEQQRKIEEMEVESRGQEGMIARQASKMDDLKTEKKKSEDALTHSIEENDALKGELGRLKEEMKAMKMEHDPLLEEVRKLREEIQEMVARMPPGPPKHAKQFPPSLKKGIYADFDVPHGIVAHLTRECGGNVHDRHVVDVTSGSFEKEHYGANPHSGDYKNDPCWVAKNAADLESAVGFWSAFRDKRENIPHTRNNWLCYDFSVLKDRRILPTHYTIRTNGVGWGNWHLKSWLVETSVDGKSWREVAREEGNRQLNGRWFTATFPVAGDGECRFIRLVNIGRNHEGTDTLQISAWEIFGVLIE
jgi:hypothetical protein